MGSFQCREFRSGDYKVWSRDDIDIQLNIPRSAKKVFNAHFVKYSIQISIALFLGVACVLYEYYISIINY